MSRRSVFLITELCLGFVGLVLARQPSARQPERSILRNLTWGKVNFVHTSDIHGWFGGHLHEPSFSADWGDYISFSEHLINLSNELNVDIIFVDTGDRVEGNALFDSSQPKGLYTYPLLPQHPWIDLICSGNHELYQNDVTKQEYSINVGQFSQQYIASNIDVYDEKSENFVPLAQRYRRFTTKNLKLQILAFGFLFNFTKNGNGSRVIPVEEVVHQEWFQSVISEQDVDMIIVVGHAHVRGPEFRFLHEYLRTVYPSLPIQFLGGHNHVRDFVVYDSMSTALESGRYMETIGWLSINGSYFSRNVNASDSSTSVEFSRSYIDNNLLSFSHHSRKSLSEFQTERGLQTSMEIANAREILNLTRAIGCVPMDLYVNRAPYPSNFSLVTFVEKSVLPVELGKSNRSVKGIPAFAIINTGSLRFDLFSGQFTRDSSYQVYPFDSNVKFIPNVNALVALKLNDTLNNYDVLAAMLAAKSPYSPVSLYSHTLYQRQRQVEQILLWSSSKGQAIDTISKPEESLGYVTHDDLGSDGDDTVHTPFKLYPLPQSIMAYIGNSTSTFDMKNDTVVDVVYDEFLEPFILESLRFMGHNYTSDDAQYYLARGITLRNLIEDYIGKFWPCPV